MYFILSVLHAIIGAKNSPSLCNGVKQDFYAEFGKLTIKKKRSNKKLKAKRTNLRSRILSFNQIIIK